MYSSRIWQFRSLNELFITRLIVPGALHRPKGILVCSVFTQSASPSPKSSHFVSFSGISFTMKLTKRWWREPKKVFVSLKMLRAWSEIIWKMALQVRSFCFFFFSALRTSNCVNSRYPFLYLHPRFSYIFHLTAVTWVLVFNIDTAERKERQTNPNEASPLFALLNRFERDS